MKERRRVPARAVWADVVGYSRAVRVGNMVYVSGTASVDDEGRPMHAGDPYHQAQRCLDIAEHALTELGATLGDVVRTRMFVTDRAHWEAVGRAHGERFAGVLPATSMLFAQLIDEALLVEIEVDAVVAE